MSKQENFGLALSNNEHQAIVSKRHDHEKGPVFSNAGSHPGQNWSDRFLKQL
jgi:hypothetical protein